MEKQKPRLTATQIKAVIERVIELFNARVRQQQPAQHALEQKRLIEWAKQLSKKLSASSLTATQKKQLVNWLLRHSHCEAWWAQDNMIGKSPSTLQIYRANQWDAAEHPLHKIIEDMRFNLLMSNVENYESMIADSIKAIDKLFK